MGPWRPPAKKARCCLEALVGGGDRILAGISPVIRFISGRLTSLLGLNPSEELALHRTRIDVL